MVIVRSDEASWVGMRVRVREGCEKAYLRGRVGRVAEAYVADDRVALHVRFEDGLWQLLWPQDVEREGGAVRYDTG